LRTKSGIRKDWG